MAMEGSMAAASVALGTKAEDDGDTSNDVGITEHRVFIEILQT